MFLGAQKNRLIDETVLLSTHNICFGKASGSPLFFFNIFNKIDFRINSLFDLILYDPPTIFQLNRDGSSWVEPVLRTTTQ